MNHKATVLKRRPTHAKHQTRSATNKPSKTTKAKKLFNGKPSTQLKTIGKATGATTAVPTPMATKKNRAFNWPRPIAAYTNI